MRNRPLGPTKAFALLLALGKFTLPDFLYQPGKRTNNLNYSVDDVNL